MSKFTQGQSGNPQGRPRGAISKRTELGRLLEPHAEELITKMVELAKQGNMNALRLCIERLIPRLKEEYIEFSLPEGSLTSTSVLLELGSKTIEAVSQGELSLEQSQRISNLLQSQCQMIEVSSMAQDIEQIKKVLKLRN
jgi:hypothetical protein